MVFNVCVRVGRMRAAAVAGAALVALAGCGRGPEFQYVEAPDGVTFAKLPIDWSIENEGWVNPRFIASDALDTAFLPGDDPIFWAAEFVGDGKDAPQGRIELQSIAAPDRDALQLSSMIETPEGFDQVSRDRVEVGHLEGYRAVQRTERDGEPWILDRLILTDPGRTTVYYVGIECSEECHRARLGEIDAIIETFRVET